MNSIHFMSERTTWRTPVKLYESLDAEFGFDFDPCPPEPVFDGLSVEWGEVSFVNPPYGRVIIDWCRKAYEEHLKGKTVVMLLPSRTDTRWFHDYIMKADEIRFLRGRLWFDDGPGRAPFPSMVVVYSSEKSEPQWGLS